MTSRIDARLAKLETQSFSTAVTNAVFVRWVVDPGPPGGKRVDPTHAIVGASVVLRASGEAIEAFTARAIDAALAMRPPGQRATVLMLDGDPPADEQPEHAP